MLKSHVLIAIASVTVVTIAGQTYIASSHNEPNHHPEQLETEVVESVWDRETESYSGNMDMTVYRSPSCGCCGGWIEHAKKHGFQITDIKTDDLEAVKQEHNIPPELSSCHTTIIDGYVMEGHIPVDDIKRFLKQKPNVVGLTVPGMPLGTPGMEAGERKQPFDILAFDEDGQVEVFKHYENY